MLGELQERGRAQGRRTGFGLAAHTLKGTLGNLSAVPAYEAARRLEDMGRTGDLDRIEEAFRRVQEQVQRVQRGGRQDSQGLDCLMRGLP